MDDTRLSKTSIYTPFIWHGDEREQTMAAAESIKSNLNSICPSLFSNRYKIECVHHNNNRLNVKIGEFQLKGGTDCVIVPESVAASDYAKHLSVIFELKLKKNPPQSLISHKVSFFIIKINNKISFLIFFFIS